MPHNPTATDRAHRRHAHRAVVRARLKMAENYNRARMRFLIDRILANRKPQP